MTTLGRARWSRRIALGLFGLMGMMLVLAGVMLAVAWQPMGALSRGARQARMERSPQWHDGRFTNPEPLVNHLVDGVLGMRDASPFGVPRNAVPVSPVRADDLTALPASGLRITWFGHSTTLVEIDGVRVLIDPVWSTRPTPIPGLGPARWYPPLMALDQLPPVDAVLISHDHYDHLDMPTVQALSAMGTRFIVPMGVGAHLAYWGVPEAHIVELNWWDTTSVRSLTVASTPARHASGRMLVDNDATLWSGFALVGAAHRVYYSGDTGLFPGMQDIGTRYGPFDCTLIEVGQYHRAWPDWHIGPEQAVTAHALVRGRVLLPVHWGLFRLAYHGWTEPVERVLAMAARTGAVVATPRPGESVEPTLPLTTGRWWPNVPWETAAQHPIVSTQVGGVSQTP